MAQGKSVKPEDMAEDEWFDANPLFDRQIGLIAFILFVLFQIFLVTKLDGGFHNIDWILVMIPYYLFELSEIFTHWLSALHCNKHADFEESLALSKERKHAEGHDDDDDVLEDDSNGLRLSAEEHRREVNIHQSSMLFHSYRLIQVDTLLY